MQRYQDSIILSTGQAVVGASVQVLTYPAGAVATIYSDNGSTTTTNPLITDGNGHFAFYAADARYSLVITKVGIAPITVSDILLEDPADGSAALSASGGAALVGFLPSGIGATAMTLQAAIRLLGKTPQQAGAVGDGVADDTTAMQNWASNGGWLFLAAGTYKITGAVTFPSNTTVIGAGQGVATVACANGDISQFGASGKSRVVFQDFTISVSVAGTTSIKGGIHFSTTCTNCTVERVEVTGVSWAGVLIQDSNYCIVRDCYFHDFRGTIQDSADVSIYNASSYNVVAQNQCFGGNEHGVMLQGSAVNNCTKNIVTGNRIGQHTTYGILDYRTANADTFTQITDNYIENIQGTTRAGASGMGLYLVSVGGVLAEGNMFNNCLVQTSSTTLTPGAIGVNGINASLAPVNIVANNIDNTTKYAAIWVGGCTVGLNISNNRIKTPAANVSGYGAIEIQGSSNVVTSSNQITIVAGATSGMGIEIVANGANNSNIAVTNNVINGGDFASIRVDQSGGFTTTGITVSGNVCTGGTASNIPLRTASIVRGSVTGNYFSSSNGSATVYCNACTSMTYSANVLQTSSTVTLLTANVCTGSYFDKTNIWNGNTGNAGTGLIVETLGNAIPTTGTWAVGDRVEQSVPVVGQPKGWRCTVAGTQGTWVSEGNL